MKSDGDGYGDGSGYGRGYGLASGMSAMPRGGVEPNWWAECVKLRRKCNRYRAALDRIARFDDAFAEVIATDERGQAVGAALAGALAAYARRVLADEIQKG